MAAAVGPVPPAAPPADTFTLSDAHIRLLRESIVLWAPVESGAPAVILTPVLLQESEEDLDAVKSAVEADVAQRAGLPLSSPPRAEELAAAERLMNEMPEALLQLLEHGQLALGKYSYRNPLRDLPPQLTAPDGLETLLAQPTVTFDFTAEHAALLRNARWHGLFMNAKRPYGDMSYFELDMMEILGQSAPRNADGHLPPEAEQRLRMLHAETMPALQVFLQQAAIAPGSYATIPVDGPWYGF